MLNKKLITAAVVIMVAGVAALSLTTSRGREHGIMIKEIQPVLGTIENSFSSTGTVLPLNRLEIKPPVGGRIEQILVQEGERVQAGQILVWMSSTERAALLDAARGKDTQELTYWQEVYKPIPLISPIQGDVIVSKLQPGQTVTVSDPIIVLSDKLIVRAQVDETDLKKVKVGQDAAIELDAFPDQTIKAQVGHIYYESQTVNNVTIYEVDIIPSQVPDFFRSGMNASVKFIENRKADILVLPWEAVEKKDSKSFVLVRSKDRMRLEPREIQTGISDDQNVEIVSGLGRDETVVVKSRKYALPEAVSNSNPLVPARRRPGQR